MPPPKSEATLRLSLGFESGTGYLIQVLHYTEREKGTMREVRIPTEDVPCRGVTWQRRHFHCLHRQSHSQNPPRKRTYPENDTDDEGAAAPSSSGSPLQAVPSYLHLTIVLRPVQSLTLLTEASLWKVKEETERRPSICTLHFPTLTLPLYPIPPPGRPPSITPMYSRGGTDRRTVTTHAYLINMHCRSQPSSLLLPLTHRVLLGG